jgi:hypothetical protein
MTLTLSAVENVDLFLLLKLKPSICVFENGRMVVRRFVLSSTLHCTISSLFVFVCKFGFVLWSESLLAKLIIL